MTKAFRPYTLDQQLLLPPDMRQWLPEGDLALFISDVVDELDLSVIYGSYETGDGRGQPPYDPAMLVKVLLYAYCTGLRSSRKIERATYRDVAIRVLAGDQHPDHDSIAAFRQRHLPALAGLFVQGLRLCQAAGLVKLGHVALDGTKVQANASKHKAMSYARMTATEQQLEREVRALLDQAAQADAADDAQYGTGSAATSCRRSWRRASQLAEIRAAKAVLEQQARAAAAREQRVGSAKGRVPNIPDPARAQPEPGAQYNFTDPASRIMLDGASKSWVQAYNAQAVVDDQAQVIVACAVTQEAIEVQQFVPLLTQVQTNTGQRPAMVTADAGYFSEANLTASAVEGIDCYVPPDWHTQAPTARTRSAVAEWMREKLRAPEGRQVYARRKAIVEPVFGQAKEGRAFRRFSLRGYDKVIAEWALICLTHNQLKLFRVRTCPQPA